MSSRIADIVIQAKLETRQFQQELVNLRNMIERTLGGLIGFTDVARDSTRSLRQTGEEVQATRRGVEELTEGMTEAADEARDAASGMESVADEGKKIPEVSGGATESLKDMKKEAERLSTQMRWVARDVMRVGFTAGLMGASFLAILKDIAQSSMSLLVIFEDVAWFLEDIGMIIGGQIAPILETLIVPFEFIRDFLDAHKTVALLIGVVLILAAVFFSLASMILFTIGMYGVLIFGMAMFTEEVKTAQTHAKKTGGIFQVLTGFIRAMGSAMLGLRTETTQTSAQIQASAISMSKAWQNVLQQVYQGTMGMSQSAMMAARSLQGLEFPSPPLKNWMWSLNLLKDLGTISKEQFNIMSKEIKSTFPKWEVFKYNVGASLRALRGFVPTVSGIVAGVRKIPGAMKKSGKAIAGVGVNMAKGAAYGIMMYTSFLMMQEVMKAFMPIIEVVSELFGELMQPLIPTIELIAELISQHTELVAAIMAIAVAVLALSGVSVPLVVIAMAILAVIYLLTRAAEWLSEVLHEKSLSDSIRAVTEAFKMLFIPGYAVFKLLKMLAPSGKKASKVFKGMLDKVRGIGAWIRNIVPEPLMDFADAILQHLPNPLTILENAATILEGFFDIISGDWETGKTKIITGVKNIILELAKIPLMLPKIGIEIIKQLWEGIKSFVGWLKEKIIGGSLVWDIVGWFAMLPLQLFEIGLKMLGQLFEGIAQKISGFLGDDGIGGVIGDIVGLFLGIPAELLYIGADMINYLWSGLKLWWDLITQGEFTALIVEIIAFFVGIPGKLFEYGKSMMTKLKEGILEIIPAIFGDTVLGKFLTDLTTFFADLAISFFDWGKHLIDELVRGIRDKGPDVVKEILKHITPIPVYMPTSPAKKGPLKDLRNWGQGFYGEFGKGLDRGFRALGMMDRLGEMGPAGRAPPMTGGGDVTLQNEFVIYATIRDQQDLLTLRDEISMKQLEQARRTRVLTGAW